MRWRWDEIAAVNSRGRGTLARDAWMDWIIMGWVGYKTGAEDTGWAPGQAGQLHLFVISVPCFRFQASPCPLLHLCPAHVFIFLSQYLICACQSSQS